MKQVWLSLFLVTTFVIACSSSETAENNTTKNVESTVNTDNGTSDVSAQSVAITEPTTTISETEVTTTTTKVENRISTDKTVPVEPKSTTVEETIKERVEATVVEEKPTTIVNHQESVVKTTTTEPAPSVTSKTVEKPTKVAFSHDAFDALLRKYVNSSGNVDYAGFKKDKTKLGAYLELLKNNPPESSWSKNKEMAYWINLYNAFTIHSIVEKYPISSVMDLEGGKVWDKKKIVIGGKSLSLNNIEKDKLLKRFKDPRVHFAVNCAAASCPPLLNKAWTEDNVQRYYAKSAKAFINNSKYNSVSEKNIEASQIFNWYASDFGGSDKVIPYFQKYSETKIKDNAKVSFKEYDWKLNKQ